VIDIRNIGSVACSVDGYPLVNFVASSGASVGQMSMRSGETGPEMIVLGTGAVASSTVWTMNPGVPDVSYCQPASATEVRLRLPGDAAELSAVVAGSICAAHSDVSSTPFVAGDTVTLYLPGTRPARRFLHPAAI
jgi:hypothetical protein